MYKEIFVAKFNNEKNSVIYIIFFFKPQLVQNIY